MKIFQHFKLIAAISAVACLFSGCVSSKPDTVTIRIYNETKEPVSNLNIMWGGKDYWGENKCSFGEILPGEHVEFDIHTQPSDSAKQREVVYRYKWRVIVAMDYVWNKEKYEYPRISSFSTGDIDSRKLWIQGKTVVTCKFALAGPPILPKVGIVRKNMVEELEILNKQKAIWKTADRIDVQKSWMEKIPKKNGSHPDWDWVQKESGPIILSDGDRKKLVAILDTLIIPERSSLDEGSGREYTIRIYRQDQLVNTLILNGFDGILGVPGINTTLRFPFQGRCRRSDCWKLFQKLFSAPGAPQGTD